MSRGRATSSRTTLASESNVGDGFEEAAVAVDGVQLVEVERPANPAFGDFATNLAMKLARPLRRPPLEIADALRQLQRHAGDSYGYRFEQVGAQVTGSRRTRGISRSVFFW